MVDNEMTDVVVLAGGLGTRMRGTMGDTPKVLADMGGMSFIERLILEVSLQGFSDFILCVGHGAAAIEARIGSGSVPKSGIRVMYSREDRPLGTAGALLLALGRGLSDPFIAMNGDTWCRINYDDMLDAHAVYGSAVTVAVQGHTNAGTYVLSRSALDGVPDGRLWSLEDQVLPALAKAGRTRPFEVGKFHDIGTPEGLEAARAALAPEGTWKKYL